MHNPKMRFRRFSILLILGLLLIGVFTLAFHAKPVIADTDLLVDPGFSDSADSADLRTNAAGQDWYESRGGFSSGNASLLTLDSSNVAGDNTKKAALLSYGATATQNAYCTQEFSSPQSGNFNVSFDIYIDRIAVNAAYNGTACIFVGDDRFPANAPTGTSDERFVLMCFYDSTPGSSGTDIEIRARTLSTQSFSDTSAWTSVATGLSYKTWYRVKIIVNVTSGSYDVYVDGALKKSNVAKYPTYTNSSVYYMTFDADGDRRGDYYIDNVFSPDPETQIKVVSSASLPSVGEEFTVYINVTDVTDLYGWEFQFDYDPSILDLTYNDTVSGGLNTPINVFKNSTDEGTGHLWWALSSAYPTTSGTAYVDHAIFEMHFKGIATGTSSLNLSSTILSDSSANAISHTVVNGSVTVQALDLTVDSVEILNKHGNETWVGSIYANDTYADLSTYYYLVNVTISNTGTAAASNFKVKLEVYYDTTLESSGEKTVTSLPALSSLELTFTDVFSPKQTGSAGKYSLNATVDSENVIAESDELNNVLEKKDFMVTVMGDTNGDKTVNILDAVKLALAWTGKPGDAQWNVYADLNHDDIINISDGVRMALYWGTSW